jgi:hypothetical protein
VAWACTAGTEQVAKPARSRGTRGPRPALGVVLSPSSCKRVPGAASYTCSAQLSSGGHVDLLQVSSGALRGRRSLAQGPPARPRVLPAQGAGAASVFEAEAGGLEARGG